MLEFSVLCPWCRRPTTLSVSKPCLNVRADGSVCGFGLPVGLSGGNGEFCRKTIKHTQPPKSGATGPHSWVPTAAEYAHDQEDVYSSGSVFADPGRNFLCSVMPLTSGHSARVEYPLSGTAEAARFSVMPMNTRIQDTHHRYASHCSGLIDLTSGMPATIQFPATSGDPFRVFVNRSLVATFDSATRTLRQF